MTYKVLTVPRTGIEPALPFDNKILSLARLPVPPSGPIILGVQYYAFAPFCPKLRGIYFQLSSNELPATEGKPW